MELSQVTDLQQLKSMAYDQIANKEQAEGALRAINNRILEVSQMTPAQVTANLPNALPAAPAASDNVPTSEPDGDESTTTTTTLQPSV